MMLVLNSVVGRGPSTGSATVMTVLCAGMLVAYGLDFALRVARGWLSARTGARLDTLMSAEVLHHLVQLPYRHFERTPSGVIVERLRQLDVLRGFFTGQMPVLAIDLAFVALFLAATFAISADPGHGRHRGDPACWSACRWRPIARSAGWPTRASRRWPPRARP